MSNTLATLAPVLFGAARVVPREITGYAGAVTRDFDSKGAAKGDIVKVAIAPVLTMSAVVPAQVFTIGSDRVASSKQLQLNNFNEVNWNLKTEEDKSLQNAGVAQDFFAQTVQQGIRTLVNAIEAYIGTVVQANASRAFGTPGTTPFGTSISDLANTRKILIDNGVPDSGDIGLVMNTAAGVNMRSLSNLFKVNESGTEDLLRLGEIGKIFKITVRESAQVVGPTTPGTGAGYLINNGPGYAIGATALTIGTGAGTINAGDAITLAGDTNKYIVQTALAANVVTIQEPGLQKAVANGVALTVVGARTCNHVLHRNSTVVVCRPGLQPDGPIAEQMTITDPQTGFSFLLLRVPGSALVSYYMRVVYDAFCPNPYAIAEQTG